MISPSLYIQPSLEYDTDAASIYPESPRVKNPESQTAIKIGHIGAGIKHTITSNHKGI